MPASRASSDGHLVAAAHFFAALIGGFIQEWIWGDAVARPAEMDHSPYGRPARPARTTPCRICPEDRMVRSRSPLRRGTRVCACFATTPAASACTARRSSDAALPSASATDGGRRPRPPGGSRRGEDRLALDLQLQRVGHGGARRSVQEGDAGNPRIEGGLRIGDSRRGARPPDTPQSSAECRTGRGA